MNISLRVKLIISSLAVILICGLVSTLVGIHLIGSSVIGQAQDKVRIDLNTARFIYQGEIEKVKTSVRLTALRFFIRDAFLQNNIKTLQSELNRIRNDESLDVLTLLDKNGQVMVRTRNPEVYGDSQADDKLVNLVMSRGEVAAATMIVPKEELIKEGNGLAEQANIEVIPTPMASSGPESEETSGMMIKAAAPIFGNDGNLIGVLYGGILINRNFEIVDKVKEIVYQDVKYKGTDIGTSTIFQGDLRISTNVNSVDGTRAIGTRVSKEVYNQVLVKGLPWIDRAFVVNNWYITAYEPIKNIEGEIIGILYVGILEDKFVDMRKRTLLIFMGITLTGMITAFIISYFLSSSILRPIKNLIFASKQLAKGNLEYKVDIKSNDEIKELGKTFNFMVSSIKERDERLRQRAQDEIMKSERLAMVGQLAAGVAHEINNPMGGILMFSRLLLRKAPTEGIIRENLERIEKDAKRCKTIVQGLLDFAREREPKIETFQINNVLEQAINLFENQPLFHNIEIVRQYQPDLPLTSADPSQIQQVFVNIIKNAADAMNGEGVLTLRTQLDETSDNIEISFIDTGIGISPEQLYHIFEPFFTTKEVGDGTGLGLSVSYGIIQRHGGTIKVSSQVGEGSTFIVKLPKSNEKPDVLSVI